jgi:anti-anti-sigma regulatory factor
MRYVAQTLDDCTYLLAVIGEAERDGADRLLAHVAALEADAADRVILDLTDMSFLDSSALASIVGPWLNLRGREVPATLVVPWGANPRSRSHPSRTARRARARRV